MSSDSIQRPRKILADIFHNEFTAWLVLGLSLLLTAAAWQISTVYVERRAQERFDYEVEDAKFAIVRRMQEYEQTLRGGVALLNAAGRMVGRQEWHTFVSTLNIDKYFPGLQGIGFSLWISPQDIEAVTEQVRGEGYPEFMIKPQGKRETYTSIIYLEPLAGRNLRAFGYDMFSEPTRRAAMEHARDHNEASVSGRVVLLQETNQDVQAGFLMYLPVYRAQAPVETLEQRRDALLGFVYSPFRIKDLMQGILGHGPPELDFKIFDGTQIRPDALLFDTAHGWRGAAQEPARQAAYRSTKTIELPGRTWTVTFASSEKFEVEMSSIQPQLVAAGGLTVDLLLFAIIWSLSQQRKRVVAKATEMTAELRRSNEQFRAITETAYDAILSTDESGTIIYCNPSASAAFGLPADKLVGMPVEALLPERLRTTRQPGLLASTAQGRKAPLRDTLETVGLRAGSHEFPLEISVSSWEADGQRYFTLLMRDITERKRNDRLKSEFVSTVSHELRTPLTAIRGALGLLRADNRDVSVQQRAELIDLACQNTERLVRLVNDILDLEKLESGSLALELEQVCVPELLRQTRKANQHYALPHDVSLVLAEPLPEVWVWADPNRLMQVLANLISNAIKFSPPGATVSLGATVKDGLVRVSVTDTGPGIPEQFRDRIFQRFSQADASDSRQKGGTGLGLSICKSIVELHGGHIGYDTAPDQGTCFYFDVEILAEQAGVKRGAVCS